MSKLTQDQIKILEYYFAHLNINFEDVPSAKIHGTMEGIQQQLDSGSNKVIYSYRNRTGGVTITSMKVGEETEESKKELNKIRESVSKYWKELHEFRSKKDTFTGKLIDYNLVKCDL
jgi:succinate dehydrogenase/fumarate reductase flavoprotein subunit